jgi:hypothetical protein
VKKFPRKRSLERVPCEKVPWKEFLVKKLPRKRSMERIPCEKVPSKKIPGKNSL